MIKPFTIILFCLTLFSCGMRKQPDISQYHLIFDDNFWLKVDLKSKVLTVDFDSLKYTDTLKFTPAEEQELANAFSLTRIYNTKGSIQYDPESDTVIMPSFYNTIIIYKGNKFISAIKINDDCTVLKSSADRKKRAVQFRDVIKSILNKNKKCIEARQRYQKYMSDHHMFYL